MAPSRFLLTMCIISLFQHMNTEQIICSKNRPCSCKLTTVTGEIIHPTGETCTIDCIAEDLCKETLITCRPGDRCVINCHGKNACSAGTKISAINSTDVIISCEKDNACKDKIDIECGTGDCKLECNDPTSCDNFGTIDVSKSKSFICIGAFCPNNIPLSFSLSPTISPTMEPTFSTQIPTNIPTVEPTTEPTIETTFTDNPTMEPTYNPTNIPSTNNPTKTPSKSPTNMPSITPTIEPTYNPSKIPSVTPTKTPTIIPSKSPTTDPTSFPSFNPTINPTILPTKFPTNNPTYNPTLNPSINPTKMPTVTPTQTPTMRPTGFPSATYNPSIDPTKTPSVNPTIEPTTNPSKYPSVMPTETPLVFTTSDIQPTGIILINDNNDRNFNKVYYKVVNSTTASVVVIFLISICMICMCILTKGIHTKRKQQKRQIQMSNIGNDIVNDMSDDGENDLNDDIENYCVEFISKPFGIVLTNKYDKKNIFIETVELNSFADINGVVSGSKIIKFEDENVENKGSKYIKKIFHEKYSDNLPLKITFKKPNHTSVIIHRTKTGDTHSVNFGIDTDNDMNTDMQ